MSARIPPELLRKLRNEVEIRELIKDLGLPWKTTEGVFRFLCPVCSDYHTATNPATNLARCFICERNFNPIDLTMIVKNASFLEAVRFLWRENFAFQPYDHPHLP